jgi:hypothetical protein
MRTDMTKLIVAFPNLANAPKNVVHFHHAIYIIILHSTSIISAPKLLSINLNFTKRPQQTTALLYS